MCSRDSVRLIGDAIGVSVDEHAADSLKRSVESRLRDLIKDAATFMTHSHRGTLTTGDINLALKQRNVEPLYGYSSGDPLAFRPAAEDLFFQEDHTLNLEEVLRAELPPVPRDPCFSIHWLMVDGVQPEIPENPLRTTVEALEAQERAGAAGLGPHGGEADADAEKRRKIVRKTDPVVKAVVKHVLSKEQQLYLEHVTVAIKGTDDILKKAALQSVGHDEGLHQLVPYLTQFIADEVTHNMHNLPLLRSLMQLASCLVSSPHLHIEPYLHQLMPWILTCLVGRRLCANPLEDHWSLRDFCAKLVAAICSRFGSAYRSLQPRITKTLTRAFLDPRRPLTTHYGAITGLQALGQHVTKTLILPHLPVYLKLLETVLVTAANPTKRMEATNCYAALLHAAGQYVRHEFREAQFVPLLYQHVRASQQPAAAPAAEAKVAMTDDSEEDQKAPSKEAPRNGPSAEAPVSMEFLFELFGETLLPFAHTHQPIGEQDGATGHGSRERWSLASFI